MSRRTVWPRIPPWLRLLVPAAAVAALASCSTVGYYAQSVAGQAELLNARRPIDDVVADTQTPDSLRERLVLAQRIREFASRELGLPDNGSYRSYADLKRRYVVWNVFATPALSIQPLQWCFPVAGCVSYRGYFSREEAQAFADGLARAGNDVFVAGVPAYSTLGWFDDPVLNTFIHYPQAELARLVFHELAHQVVYVRDDTVFNESFAVAVELEGVRRWLDRHGSEADRASFERTGRLRAQFARLAGRYRDELTAVYASAADDATKLAGKRAVLARLAEEYAAAKQGWGGFAGYDPWLGAGANNATLASIGIYSQRVPAFRALLAREGGDLPRFYAAVRDLAALPRAERDARLAELHPDDPPPVATGP